MSKKTATTIKKHLPKHNGGTWVHFTHRDTMQRVTRNRASLPKAVPATTLPVDCTGNGTCSWPMDGNDSLGDCGPVMCAHVNGIRTFGQGKTGFSEVLANVAALESQYEQVSGGDNGTDEPMLVGAGGIWLTGIANDPTQVVVDHLDVDLTDAPLVQYCHDQFYATCMAWSVPDDVLQNFSNGEVFASADTPDPNNGHFTPLTDVGGPTTTAQDGTNIDGFYRLITWGAYCWVSPAFVGSVQPQGFVTFSPLQFSKETGYDSHGRHVSDQAAKWVAIGGNASLVAAVVAMFPPAAGPVVTPPASGVLSASQVTSVQAAVSAVVDPCDALIEKVVIAPALQAAVAALGPAS
jgi:hypothetical protein